MQVFKTSCFSSQLWAVAAVLGLFSGPALTQSQQAPAAPCTENEAHRAFDFWLGVWDVSVANGQLVGRNVIKEVAGGCALTEHWQSTSASTGVSLNYFDVTSNEWVQIWSGNGGSQISIRGGIVDGSMVLVGHISYVGGNTDKTPFRGTWTLLDDGRVRQFFEQYSTDDETWQPWFEGFYARVAAEDKVQ